MKADYEKSAALLQQVPTGNDGAPDESPSGPENNSAMPIMLEKDGDDYQWVFYQSPRGQGAGCNTDKKVMYVKAMGERAMTDLRDTDACVS